jgi:hypothetical protein
VVVEAAPDVVVELTAFRSLGTNLRRFPRDAAQTNRLRTDGTDLLGDATLAPGAQRLDAQRRCYQLPTRLGVRTRALVCWAARAITT